MMRFILGHPNAWLGLLILTIVAWATYAVVRGIQSRRPRTREQQSRRYTPEWIVFTIAVLSLFLPFGTFYSYMWTNDHSPREYATRVLTPVTIAADGSRYVVLNDDSKAWTCQPADRCDELKVGEYAIYTAYRDPDNDVLRLYDLRPAE